MGYIFGRINLQDKLTPSFYPPWPIFKQALTEELATQYEDSIDFFYVATFCNVEKKVILKYADKWDAKRVVKRSQTNSDGWWSYEQEEHCWAILSNNRRIRWDDELINTFIDKIYFNGLDPEKVNVKVNTINKYWYRQNEFHGRGVISSDHEHMEGPSYYKANFSNILRYATIEDITWEDFVENEYKWYGVLNDNSSVISME